MGAIGRDVPVGAQYIYNVNFFAGFIVASGTYWCLCKLSPIPATSKVWMEVGDEIRNVSVAYGAEERFDEESEVGAEVGKGGDGLRERKAVGDY